MGLTTTSPRPTRRCARHSSNSEIGSSPWMVLRNARTRKGKSPTGQRRALRLSTLGRLSWESSSRVARRLLPSPASTSETYAAASGAIRGCARSKSAEDIDKVFEVVKSAYTYEQ